MPYFGDPPLKGKSKWGIHELPSWPQRSHFVGNHDIMEKRRLATRTFGHKRHHVYNNLSITQPPRESIWYAPEEERLTTDFESLLKTQHEKTQARKKAMIDFQKTRRAYRDYKFFIEREKGWNKMLEREEFFRQKPHARVIANKNSVAYDLINLQYHDGFEGERLKYQDACLKWRENMRAEFLQARMSGNRNYNVISWAKLSPGVHSEKPIPPELPKVNQIHAGKAKPNSNLSKGDLLTDKEPQKNSSPENLMETKSAPPKVVVVSSSPLEPTST